MSGLIFQVILFLILFSVGWGFGRHIEQKHLRELDEKEKKLVDAYKWYDLAARDGMLSDQVRTRAQSKIGQLALNLSSQDIATARIRADSWFQSK
jgi:TPR repeat protein